MKKKIPKKLNPKSEVESRVRESFTSNPYVQYYDMVRTVYVQRALSSLCSSEARMPCISLHSLSFAIALFCCAEEQIDSERLEVPVPLSATRTTQTECNIPRSHCTVRRYCSLLEKHNFRDIKRTSTSTHTPSKICETRKIFRLLETSLRPCAPMERSIFAFLL